MREIIFTIEMQREKNDFTIEMHSEKNSFTIEMHCKGNGSNYRNTLVEKCFLL